MYTIFINNKISVYGNKFKDINDKIKSNEIKQISCGYDSLMILAKNDGLLVISNENQSKSVISMKNHQIRQISCGIYHYMNNGELLVFSDNGFGTWSL